MLLVGCGDSAADEACAQLQEYETDVVEADEDHANEVLTATYADMNDLAEETEGELGEALVELQPLFLQLESLTGADETAAAEAQETVAELSEEELDNIDDAADYVNETCELSVLL
ncbi:MAG: hypothetical protein L0J06_10475 [Yaniella sp.]|nr:hypothetical protein [Yaniella sp.]